MATEPAQLSKMAEAATERALASDDPTVGVLGAIAYRLEEISASLGEMGPLIDALGHIEGALEDENGMGVCEVLKSIRENMP